MKLCMRLLCGRTMQPFAQQHSQFVLPFTVKIFSNRLLIGKVPVSKLLHF